MSSRHYTTAEKAGYVARLRESADGNGGEPVWKRCEADLGIARETLRRWWKDRDRFEKLSVLPKPERVTPAAGERLPDPLSAPPSVFYAYVYSEIAVDIDAARESAPTALGGLRKAQIDAYERVQSALAEERKAGRGLTPEERREKLKASMHALPPADAVLAAEVLRKRGIMA